MYAHFISITIFERLNQFDLEIYKVDHEEYIIVYGDVTYH
jgi:hypothetical protein